MWLTVIRVSTYIRYSGFMPRRLKHWRITTAVDSHKSNRLDCSGLPMTCRDRAIG